MSPLVPLASRATGTMTIVEAVSCPVATIAGGTLLKRIADPSEIVGPVLYLASDASSFVTGDDISVSGGMQK